MATPKYVTHPELNAYTEKIRQIATKENDKRDSLIEGNIRRIENLEKDFREMNKVITEVRIKNNEIHSLVKNTDKNITNMTGTIFPQLKDLRKSIEETRNMTSTVPILQRAVFGAIGAVIIAVIGAVLSLVLIRV